MFQEIVYTPAHKKLHLNQYFFLDLNHDGANDFRFFIRTSRSTDGCFASLRLSPVGPGNGAVGKITGSHAFPSALKAGVPIGKSQYFLINPVQIMGLFAGYFGEGTFSGQWANSGVPVDHRYLGLKFVLGGQVHYGWARFNVLVLCTVNATLTGYAYETIPNKPIITGKTKGPDAITVQPATLGHLAAGASAIPAWRSGK